VLRSEAHAGRCATGRCAVGSEWSACVPDRHGPGDALSSRGVSKRALAGSGDVYDEGGRLRQQESIEPAAGLIPIAGSRIGGIIVALVALTVSVSLASATAIFYLLRQSLDQVGAPGLENLKQTVITDNPPQGFIAMAYLMRRARE